MAIRVEKSRENFDTFFPFMLNAYIPPTLDELPANLCVWAFLTFGMFAYENEYKLYL